MKPLDDEKHWGHFPVTGTGDDRSLWPLGEALLKDFRDTYPQMDMLPTLKQADMWVKANKANRKTAGGMPKFLNNWLVKAIAKRSFVPLPGADARPAPRRPTPEREPTGNAIPTIKAIAQGAGGGDDFDLAGGPT